MQDMGFTGIIKITFTVLGEFFMIFHSDDNHSDHIIKGKIGRPFFFILWAGLIIFGIWSLKHAVTDKKNSLKEDISHAVLGEEGKVTTITKASLDKVFEISELSTADYIYNAVARAYGEDKTTVTYYVAYEGKVKAGIDFEKLDITIREDEKQITIKLPDIEFQEQTVDPGTLKYIFKDKESQRENIHQEAFELCEKDLRERVLKEKDLKEQAKKNAQAVVLGLVEPWIKQIDSEYSITVQ